MTRSSPKRERSLDKKQANYIAMNLQGLQLEVRHGGPRSADDGTLIATVADILIHAGVDSRDVVEILERPMFGETGEDAARAIKVDEGW